MKTNAARVLDTLGISYELLSYRVDPDNLVATVTADKLGLPAGQVFKTLVVTGNRQGIALAVVPASYHLDLKAIAKLSGDGKALSKKDRKVETVPLKQVQPLTGYIRGGVTAIACKKPYPVFLDEWAEAHEHIAVSAGVRGQMLWLSPADYIRATGATVGAISTEKQSE